MIVSLVTALCRVTLFWYLVGALFVFLGDPDWAEQLYTRLQLYPGVPHLEMRGLSTAATVQAHLVLYWTLPVLALWLIGILAGCGVSLAYGFHAEKGQRVRLQPRGSFWGVIVPGYSIGRLPCATTPSLVGQPVVFEGLPSTITGPAAKVQLQDSMLEAFKLLTDAERQLCAEILQLLLAQPNHFAGLGHGVGLLEHTLNVVTAAAAKCTPDFKLPVLAALAHDIGKLITFKPDGKGGWVRKGLHSRESARILATLPGFQALPELHRDALILAVKYDHAPNKMPSLRGERDAAMLAMRTISALSMADRTATAGEKERNLEKLKPEDLLWQDFVDFLREAPVVQRGKKGAANQVNNPPDSPYLFIYEAPWRDAAIPRMPAEVAAALDLTRRDSGKLAKYTRILAERLRREGLLVETFERENKETKEKEVLNVSESNPLWDIQSGTGEKAVVLRGILVLNAEALWKKVNYRLGTKSPFPVQILAPNANADGMVNKAPTGDKSEPPTPEISDSMKIELNDTAALATLGIESNPGQKAATAKVRRPGFKAPTPVATDNATFGLKKVTPKPEPKADTSSVAAEASAPVPPEASVAQSDVVADAPLQESDLDKEYQEAMAAMYEEATRGESTSVPDTSSASITDMALALYSQISPTDETPVSPSEASEEAISTEEVAAPVQEAKGTDAAPTPEQQPTPDAPPATASTPPAELSRAEKRHGLAIADEAACALYPKLALGDKYYTEESPAVKQGLTKPGSRYKGDKAEKSIASLSATTPKRTIRRF